MKKALLFSALIMGANTSVYATSNSLEIDVTELEYNRPNRGIGFAGELKFSKMNMFRDGMVIALDNKEDYFNSKIFVRPTFIGIKSPSFSLGFALEKEIISGMEKARLKNSRVVMNDKYFIFSADQFEYKDNGLGFTLENFRYYCGSNSKHDALSVEGIVAGCLTGSNVNSKKEDENDHARLTYLSIAEDGNETKLQGEVQDIEIKSNKIDAKLIKTNMSVAGFDITTGAVNLVCSKDSENLKINADKLKKDCLSDLTIDVPSLSLVDQTEGTQFDLAIDMLKIHDEKLNFASRWTAMSDEETRTHILNLKLNCGIDRDVELFDLQEVIAECLEEGEIDISHIITEEIKKGQLTKRLNAKDATLKDLKVRMNGNKLILDAKVFAVFKLMSIHMEATVVQDKNAGILELNLTKVKLPLGIRSTKMMLKLIKKYMVSETVKVSNNKIYIQF